MSDYRVILDDPNDITTGWGICNEQGAMLYTSESLLTKERAQDLADAHNAGCESYEQACAFLGWGAEYFAP